MVEDVKFNAASGQFLVTFNPYRHQQRKQRILLTGTFNFWDWQHKSVNGLFMGKITPAPVTIALNTGIWEYKYYDLEADRWLEIHDHRDIYWHDEPDCVTNPFGTLNCRLVLAKPHHC